MILSLMTMGVAIFETHQSLQKVPTKNKEVFQSIIMNIPMTIQTSFLQPKQLQISQKQLLSKEPSKGAVLTALCIYLDLIKCRKVQKYWDTLQDVSPDRTVSLSVPCPSHKKLYCKNFNVSLMPTPTPTPGVVQ